jgi:hypothetical protein
MHKTSTKIKKRQLSSYIIMAQTLYLFQRQKQGGEFIHDENKT